MTERRWSLRPESSGNATITRKGEQIGYLEDWKLYLYGEFAGEIDNYPEMYHIIDRKVDEHEKHRMD